MAQAKPNGQHQQHFIDDYGFKPRLRGVIHNFAAFVAAAVGILLVLDAHTPKAAAACAVYALTTTLMFGFSAAYHRPSWGPRMRKLMRRLDHSAIFLLIAGTNTPLSMLALPPAASTQLLTVIWTGAIAGVVQSLFFPKAPKPLKALLYVLLGWAVLPFVGQFKQSLHPADVGLVVAGGVVYSVGAVVYATRRPDPAPATFGYHEVFHTLVTLAALLHYAAVYRVVNSAAEKARQAG